MTSMLIQNKKLFSNILQTVYVPSLNVRTGLVKTTTDLQY